jgi:hypothetical protein
LEEALYKNPVYEGTYEAFLAKYAGATLDQLLVAQLAMDLHAAAERKRITEEMMHAGDYETQILQPGEQAKVPEPENGTVAFGFSITPGDGFTTVNIAKIDPQKHPEFALIAQEKRWLGTYLRQMGVKGAK